MLKLEAGNRSQTWYGHICTDMPLCTGSMQSLYPQHDNELDHSQYVLCLWLIWPALLFKVCTIIIELTYMWHWQPEPCLQEKWPMQYQRTNLRSSSLLHTKAGTEMANNWLSHSMTSEFRACLNCKHPPFLYLYCSKIVLTRWHDVTYLNSDSQSHCYRRLTAVVKSGVQSTKQVCLRVS